MSFARWLGGGVLFLLVGAIGYIVAGLLLGFVLAALFATGNMTMADLAEARYQPLIEAISILGGAALAWFAVGRRYWKRWKQSSGSHPG